MKRSPIRKVSARRAKENREYLKLRKAFLFGIGKHCAICYREYQHCVPSTEIHHINGREGKRLLVVSDWLPVCFTHHRRIHDNPRWARARGYLK
jgi:hypothetical protein